MGKFNLQVERGGTPYSPKAFLNLDFFFQILFLSHPFPQITLHLAAEILLTAVPRPSPLSICLFVFLGFSLQSAVLYKQNYPFMSSPRRQLLLRIVNCSICAARLLIVCPASKWEGQAGRWDRRTGPPAAPTSGPASPRSSTCHVNAPASALCRRL